MSQPGRFNSVDLCLTEQLKILPELFTSETRMPLTVPGNQSGNCSGKLRLLLKQFSLCLSKRTKKLVTTWWLGRRCRRRLKHMKGLRLFFHELILIFLLLFFLMETRRNWPPGMFYHCLTKPSVNGINTNTHREPLSRQAPGRAFLFPSRFQGHQPLPVEKTEKLLWP